MKNNVKFDKGIFSDAVSATVRRSTFQRNSGLKTTFNAGNLIPVYVDEVIAGDTFDIDLSFVGRLATPIFPTMDNLKLDFYAFYTPMRLLWTGWEELNGENKTGAWTPTNPPALVPQYLAFDSTPVKTGSLLDYMGIPVGIPLNVNGVSALPLRNYYLIWNEWFRDQNLQAPVTVRKNSANGVLEGTGLASLVDTGSIVLANKPHDYFTSCLPEPQKGSSQLIPIELNELLPVVTKELEQSINTDYPLKWRTMTGTTLSGASILTTTPAVGGTPYNATTAKSDSSAGTTSVVPSNLYADTQGAITSTTIADLRMAFQLQKLYERDARGGTRYIEMLKNHFGVEVADYRLQRPEYLGKVGTYFGQHQVPQTSSTDSTSPQGNVSSFAHCQGFDKIFRKSFVEPGYVMILAVARADKTYQQGIERFWFRKDRFDFYYPALAHISEQPVYKKEIYADSDTMSTDIIFGYQEAWSDYRYKPSRVSGLMRSGIPKTLDPYHYADYYTSAPLLSADWIKDNTKVNLNRTLAVKDTISDQIILDLAIFNKSTRPMPVYSVPGLVDHF